MQHQQQLDIDTDEATDTTDITALHKFEEASTQHGLAETLKPVAIEAVRKTKKMRSHKQSVSINLAKTSSLFPGFEEEEGHIKPGVAIKKYSRWEMDSREPWTGSFATLPTFGKDLGKLIRKWRLDNNCGMKQFAEAVKLTYRKIQYLESGEQAVTTRVQSQLTALKHGFKRSWQHDVDQIMDPDLEKAFGMPEKNRKGQPKKAGHEEIDVVDAEVIEKMKLELEEIEGAMRQAILVPG